MNVKSKSKRNKKNRKKYDLQNQIVQEKNKQIESLKSEILKLELDAQKKDELISSVDYLRVELQDIVQDMNDKKEEYDALIEELMLMRKVFNEEVFNNNWWIIRKLMHWLMR